jgi:hypothetical protein
MATARICRRCSQPIDPGRVRCPCACAKPPRKPVGPPAEPAVAEPAMEEGGRIGELARKAVAGEELFPDRREE